MAAYSETDQRILQALSNAQDPDYDPKRVCEEEAEGSGSELEAETQEGTEASKFIGQHRQQQQPDEHQTSIPYQDTLLRHNLGVGGAKTGPKGVLADARFHAQQERARAAQKQRQAMEKMDQTAMRSGWLRRQIKKDTKHDDVDTYDDDEQALREEEELILSEWHSRRLLQPHTKFGKVFELSTESFIEAIDNESLDTPVIIHIYDSTHPECRIVDSAFIALSRRYTGTKFCRMSCRDIELDVVALPTVLGYMAGELVSNLVRVTDEVDGDLDTDSLEQLFIKEGLVDTSTALNITHSALSSTDIVAEQLDRLNVTTGGSNKRRGGLLSGLGGLVGSHSFFGS